MRCPSCPRRCRPGQEELGRARPVATQDRGRIRSPFSLQHEERDGRILSGSRGREVHITINIQTGSQDELKAEGRIPPAPFTRGRTKSPPALFKKRELILFILLIPLSCQNFLCNGQGHFVGVEQGGDVGEVDAGEAEGGFKLRPVVNEVP